MDSQFRLLMVSAMYENGGNTTHRFFDGHPQMFVYPFESQLGTRLVNDALTSMFPVKYRWPVFALDATPTADYQLIIDEECKVRARTPNVSKFRHVQFDFSDEARRQRYVEYVAATGRSTGANVEAFFRSTFDAWKDYRRTGEETVYVGYSPIVAIDTDRILADIPDAHVLHVVRNPWSAYADTKKRPVPMTLASYIDAWNLNQYRALFMSRRHADRVHIVRIEDVMDDPATALGALCDRLGVERSASLKVPSWNGAQLDEVYPWGTIRRATGAANRATALELDANERAEVADRAWQYLDEFGYRGFV